MAVDPASTADASACTFGDLPGDIYEAVASILAKDDPQAVGRLLCTCKTVRAALNESEPVWRGVADWFGADCAAKKAPLDDAELGAAAMAALDAALPSPLGPVEPIPGGWGMPAMALGPCPDGPSPGWETGLPRALFDARHALELERMSRVQMRATDRPRSPLNVDVSWASMAAPKTCPTYKEAVQRYAAVLGRYGAHGARAARVWARWERFLADNAVEALNALLPGWRGKPPEEEVDAAVRVHPAVAAVLALHAGQLTLPRVRDWGEDVDWLPTTGREALGLPRPEFMRGMGSISAVGVVACYNAVRTGMLHCPYMAQRIAEPDRATGGLYIEAPFIQQAVVVAQPNGTVGLRAAPTGTMFPFVVHNPDGRFFIEDGPEVLGCTVWLDLATSALYAPAAAELQMVDRRTGAPTLPALIPADGGGQGLLAWLERLVDMQESGIVSRYPLIVQLEASTWDTVRAGYGNDVPESDMALCGHPALPLDRGLSPSDLAALAAAWPDAGVSVALTGGVFQIVAGLVYAADTSTFNARETYFHSFSYRITMRLLDADVPADDAAGTWPPLSDPPLDDGTPGGFAPLCGSDHFPVQGRVPALRSARLVRRRWVIYDAHGRFKDTVDGDGVVGQTPTLAAGDAGPHFSYASRHQQFALALDASVLPGALLGYMDGAFLFEGEPLDGGPTVRVWARCPRMTLRVPVWRF